MVVILHSYEDKLIRDLPLLKARYVAETLLTRYSIAELLTLQLAESVDVDLMNSHKLPYDLWPDIVRAALLARISYIHPSHNLSKQKILLLVKLAIEFSGLNSSVPLSEAVVSIKSDYAYLAIWLTGMAKQLTNLSDKA